ncbi:MAG: hypothetical protein R3F60_21750 [bacterium]
MRRWLWLWVLALGGCDSGGGGGGGGAVDAASMDGAVDARLPDAGSDAAPVVDEGVEADAAPRDAEPAPDAMRRPPVGVDAPRARECPATPRAPQVALTEATGAAERQYDGPVTVESRSAGTIRLALPGGSLALEVPPRVAALFNENEMFDALLRRRTMGFTEWILVLRQEGKIAFAAVDGTSWVLQQFSERAAVGEAVDVAGGCAEAGERCFDRVDREMVFAGGNRRRALLPGTETDFTTDGGTFVLAVDQGYQVACQVLCPNVATQRFAVWMLRDADPAREGDFDGDGVADAVDVCVAVPDPDQADGDGDGTGDACPPGAPCAHPLDCPSRQCEAGACVGSPYVIPGAPEVCDGDDDDGDGTIDEGVAGCTPETACTVDAVVTGEGLMRGQPGELSARVTSACPAVTVDRVAWDVGADGSIEGEGETLALRALRGMAPVAGVLRLEDSRGGVTEVPFRVPVATSEFCP